MKNLKANLVILLLLFTCQYSFAQFGELKKWFNNDVVPMFSKEKPLVVKPEKVKTQTEGKDLLAESEKKGKAVFVNFPPNKTETNRLKKEMQETDAVFSGNTAVMSEESYGQLEKDYKERLEKAEKNKEVKISKQAPAQTPKRESQVPERVHQNVTKSVIIYNHTSRSIKYILNEEVFNLEADSGFKHDSKSGEFFLQFDDDPSGKVHIARYYLTGTQYGLYLFREMDKVGIHRY